MHAMRVGRALLLAWIGMTVGCSTTLPDEKTMASGAASLVEGWAGTGAMAEARKYHAGVALPSGKVLVMGGYNGSGYLSSATQYDPATELWTVVASMPEARQAHAAALLSSGKVLVVGGENASVRLASAAVYDPATNTWASAGTFASAEARDSMPATLLPSGQVLVAGGRGAGSKGALSTVDVYDPVTGSWRQVTSMKTPRRNHTATLLPSGQVLVVGGTGSTSLATAELYDPASNTWTATGALATARYNHTATLLASGKVLVAGGRNSGGVVGTAEEYDPATGTWSPTGNTLGSARELHTATLLSSGKVLVAGGQNTSVLSSAELYDPGTRQWSAAAPMAAARNVHVAVALEGLGKVLVVGGIGGTGSSQKTAEVYVYDGCSSASCTSPPGQCYAAAGTCSGGVCSYAPKAAGTACDDGNACTGGDVCNGAGVCAGSATSCSSPPGQCYESAGTCSGGSCSYAYKAAGTACNDGNACTVGEVCNGAGGCSGTPVTCNTPPGQCYQSAGTCSSGKCSYAFKPAGTSCDDGNEATIGDKCDGGGGCYGAYECNASDHYCPPPPPTYGPWSACNFNSACTTTGYQYRTVTPYTASYICFYAQCISSQGTSYTETQTCTRPQPQVQCPTPSYGAWGACSNADVCGSGGQQSRTVTTYTANYNTCQCDPSSVTETQSCTTGPTEPYALCNNVCTDLDWNVNNCGACGHACSPRYSNYSYSSCIYGQCCNAFGECG